MRADMAAIATAAQAASAKAPTKPRVFYDVGYLDTTGQIYGPGEGSFLAEMVGLLGVDVITGDKVTYEIPLEKLIERDPEVIILGVNAFYAPTPQTVAKRNGWKALTAVKTGRHPLGERHRDHTARTTARHGDAQPRAGDVSRPPAPAGRRERHAVTARTSRTASVELAAASPLDPRAPGRRRRHRARCFSACCWSPA